MQHSLISRGPMSDIFVTFLSLKRSHVRTCIQRQLEKEHENNQYQYQISDNDVIDHALDLIEFSPPGSALYSVSGCKKVQQKLDFILESHRIPIKQEL